MPNQKILCKDCDWKGYSTDLLEAPNPFVPDDTIKGCPSCKDIDCFVFVCDEPGCWQPVTCGTPTKEGYRSTCGKHKPCT